MTKHKNEFFLTPTGLVRAALTRANETVPTPRRILDPGAGTGVWGREARRLWSDIDIMGVDLVGNDGAAGYDPDHNIMGAYTRWRSINYIERAMSNYDWFDLIIGNPPYSLAEKFIRQSQRYLANHADARIFFLLRLAFLAGQKRGKGIWKEYKPLAVHTLSRRPSFTGDGVSDPRTEYAIFEWGKLSARTPRLDWLDWDYLPGERPTRKKK